MIYMIEHAPPAKRGLYGSFALVSGYLGILIAASSIFLLEKCLDKTSLQAWGWRIPFLSGILLGGISLYFRLGLPETPHFISLKKKDAILKNPLLQIFKNNRLKMLQAMGLVILPVMAFYLIFIYLTTYLNLYFNVPMTKILFINNISIVVAIITIPIVGYLSDKIGRKPLLITGALGFIIFSYPLFAALGSQKLVLIMLSYIVLAILLIIASTTIPTTLVELFTTDCRYTGLSLSYNIMSALFSGTAPLVATVLIQKTHWLTAPSFYLMSTGIIMLIAVLSIKESYKTQW